MTTAASKNSHNGLKPVTWPVSRFLAVSALALAAACASPEQKLERYVQDAQEFLEEGDLSKAYIQYRNALKIDEENVPSLLGLADIAEQRQDFEAMFGFLQRVVRLDPSQVDAHVKLGKLYLIGSDETTALERAETALALDADNIPARSLKAGVLLKVGDNEAAVEIAREVLEQDPANPEAVTVLVTDYSVNGDNEAALAELDRALAIDPQVAMLQLLRIHVLQVLGRADDTRAAYAELIRLFPDQPAYRRVYANELINVRDYDGAQEQLEAIVDLQPENLDAKLDVVRIVKANSSVDAAAAKLQSYIDADPENTDLQFSLADFYIGEDDNARANALLDALAEDDDLDIALRAKNKISALMLANGEREQSQALTNEILEADNRNTDALLRRAAFQIEEEEYDQAIVNLRTALDNSPDSYEAMVLMSAAFERQDSMSFARAELAKAFDASNKNPRVANQFARFLLRQKDIQRAEEVLVDALSVNRRDVENLRLLASVRLAQQDWRGAEEVGVMLERAGDESDLASNIKSAAYIGLEDYNSVIETLSSRSENAPLEAQPLGALVAAYIREDRLSEAEDMLTRMLDADPENYAAQLQVARVYAAQGDTGKFEDALIRATELDSDRPEAYELLYRSYLADGRREQAAALIERGMRASPDNEALKVFKADVLLSQGDRAGALALYADLIETRPDDRIIANNFVSLSSDLRLDEASIDRALEIAKTIEDIDNPFYKDTVGWAYYRAGDYEKAVDYLSQAVALVDGNAEMLYHLGAAQFASGDEAAAKETLERALAAGGEGFAFSNEVQALLDRM